MKRFIQSVARTLGLHIERIDPRHDAFDTQRRILPDASMIFDVGANRGQTAARYRRLFPRATIHCFEPFAESARQITGAIVHNVAVSDSVGRRTLHTCRGSELNSLLPVAAGAERYMGPAPTTGGVEVETVTLDSFCEREGIASVDILKLDIQGAECLALHGASSLLGRHAVKLVYSEVLFGDCYKGQCDFADVWRCLQGFGYRLFQLYDLQFGSDMFLGFGDALFLSPEVSVPQWR